MYPPFTAHNPRAKQAAKLSKFRLDATEGATIAINAATDRRLVRSARCALHLIHISLRLQDG